MHVKEGYFFTSPKRVTSPTWGPPPPCKQALIVSFAAVIRVVTRHATLLSGEERCVTSDDPNNGCEGDYGLP